MLVLTNAINMSKKQTEIEFGSQFIESGNLHKLVKNPFHIREFETLHGIPDLVLISGKKMQHFKEFERRYINVSSTAGAARIFAALDKKSFMSEKQLCSATGLSRPYLRKMALDLMRIDALDYDKSRGYRVSRDFEMPSPKIVSIEFKLHDWQKALMQAARHSVFAAQSYVIMPASKSDLLEKNLRFFKAFGVSIGTFDTESGEFNVIWKAPSNYRNRRPKSRVSYFDSVYRVLNSLDRLEVATN
jgi:hypothetical protein